MKALPAPGLDDLDDVPLALCLDALGNSPGVLVVLTEVDEQPFDRFRPTVGVMTFWLGHAGQVMGRA